MKSEIYVGLEDVYKQSFKYGTKTGYINANTVLKFVCEKNNISVDTLKSSSRKREIVQVRQQYVWLYRALLVKRGVIPRMTLVNNHILSKHVTNNSQMMKLINKSHCLADHCWRQYENLFLTNKALGTKSIELLDELDKLIL